MKLYYRQQPKHLPSVLTFAIGAALLLFQLNAAAQVVSPYSRYGLGTIRSTVFSANKGMGEVAAPYASAININVTNPASYASLTRTTIEIGALIDGANLVTKDSSIRAASGGVSHIAFSFVPNPKHNAWAITLGMLPYSNVKYNFLQTINDSALGAYSQAFTGSGSLYQVFAGGAYKVNGFSVGANVGYIFGKLDYQKIIAFPDSQYSFASRNVTTMHMSGFTYTVGLQYQKLLYHNRDVPDQRTDIYAFAGAYFTGAAKMRANVSSYWDRFTYDATYGFEVVDTVKANFNQRSKMNMPYSFGAGVMFGNERFWLIGADFKYATWNSFTTPLENNNLNNSWRISAGAQITPDLNSRSYISRINYRLGGYYGLSEATYQGSALNEGGATFGFGFPFFKSLAHLNVTGDVGTRGGSDKNAIRENFYRFTFGLVLNDIWFVKRKFD